ncbi:autocrine proliferation repressor protein A [Thecamonas trahens ATCC 50062]|uniref:Autocrine proliferation repressor protein A n=1 Tax=Thecamonas trahens ATCC 50062 TaxID=461836 RepID=A0A0L0DQY6_THETB|nr:autocrine proliferation repressor protein A [Thecamonas trahens ATCC 50062]KNC54719.1 autocrine proliferation repressor protein A [Thecamonas trahens ATCC 50062]|eukprot:XP_013761619.1 autocrine proliferation repressor protein A [Thecamonas trahens ATCC 50062]
MRCVAFALALAALAMCASAGPLYDYVHAPDDDYTYEVMNQTIKGVDFTVYNVFLTSGEWMPQYSNKPMWTHWLQVCVPHKPRKDNDIALLYIDGGHTANKASPPSKGDALVEILCGTTGAVSAHLSAVPSEPLVFSNDPSGKSRTEDAIIAWTWKVWLESGGKADPTWLLRFPMVRSVLRAMDTIETFTASYGKDLVPVRRWLLAGASKRGWTTWMAAATAATAERPDRVVAAVPIVAPVGDLVFMIGDMYKAYNGFSFALDDYLDAGVIDYLNLPLFQSLLDLVTPTGPGFAANYSRQTILSIDATGDEFFMPEPWRAKTGSWVKPIEDAGATVIQRMVPNAEHSLTGHQIDVALTVQSFAVAIMEGKTIPVMSTSISVSDKLATIDVHIDPASSTNSQPKKCIGWHGYNKHTRDFRLITCADFKNPACLNPILWFDEPLVPMGNNSWTFSRAVPEAGYEGLFIECEFDFAGLSWLDPLKLTSFVSVAPTAFPFKPCPPTVCASGK